MKRMNLKRMECVMASGGRRGGTEIIPDAPLGQEQFRPGRMELQLLAQAADMDIHRTRIPEIVIAPDEIQKLFPAVDLAGVLHQKEHEVEFLHGQDHLGAVLKGGPAGDG